MRTPKASPSSSGGTPGSSKNINRTPSPKPAPASEVAHKGSVRGARYSNHTATKPQKGTSPKVEDHNSPHSPFPERDRRSRVSELESKVDQLENDLKLVKDQLYSAEELKEEAEKDALQSRQELCSLHKHLSDQENELDKLRQSLFETLSLVEDMKTQLVDCKASEMYAHELALETRTQLEAAKRTMDTLESDGLRAAQAHDALARELDVSRARVDFLEELACKLEGNGLEVQRLTLSEARLVDEARGSREAAEKVRSELESELRRSRCEVEELRADLMDKETELQGIWEENEELAMRLESTVHGKREVERWRSLERWRWEAAEVSAQVPKKEMKRLAVSKQIERVKSEEKWEMDSVEEIRAARAAECEAMRKAAAEAAAREEMEVVVRRLKVQSEQWRKAAEAAAAMISAGTNSNSTNNGLVLERTEGSSHMEVLDDDLMKTKTANKTNRFMSMWKKQQR